jgi:hypothetical protein
MSVAIVPTICALLVLVEILTVHTTNKTSKKTIFIFGLLYISSRLYLIVESFDESVSSVITNIAFHCFYWCCYT